VAIKEIYTLLEGLLSGGKLLCHKDMTQDEMQAVLNKVPIGGGDVYFEEGIYPKFTHTLLLKSGTNIIGNGSGAQFTVGDTSNPAENFVLFASDTYGNAAAGTSKFAMRNVAFLGDGASPGVSTYPAVYIRSADGVNIEQVWMDGIAGSVFVFDSLSNAVITNITMANAVNLALPSDTSGFITVAQFPGTGINVVLTTNGVKIPVTASFLYGTADVRFNHCRFMFGNATSFAGIRLGDGSATMTRIVIQACQFYGFGASGIGLNIDNGVDVDIMDCNSGS
jgi:hypothetical protein